MGDQVGWVEGMTDGENIERDILVWGSNFIVREKHAARKTPRNPHG